MKGRYKHAISKTISLELMQSMRLDDDQIIAIEKRRLFAQLKKEATKKSRIIVKRNLILGYHENDFVYNQKTLICSMYTVKGPRIIGKGKVFKCQRPGYRLFKNSRIERLIGAAWDIIDAQRYAFKLAMQATKPIPKYKPGGHVDDRGPAVVGRDFVTEKNICEKFGIKQMMIEPDQTFRFPNVPLFYNPPPSAEVLKIDDVKMKGFTLHEYDSATGRMKLISDRVSVYYDWYQDPIIPKPKHSTIYKMRFRYTPPFNFLSIVKVFLAKHPDSAHPLFYAIHCLYHTIMLMRHCKRRAGLITN